MRFPCYFLFGVLVLASDLSAQSAGRRSGPRTVRPLQTAPRFVPSSRRFCSSPASTSTRAGISLAFREQSETPLQARLARALAWVDRIGTRGTVMTSRSSVLALRGGKIEAARPPEPRHLPWGSAARGSSSGRTILRPDGARERAHPRATPSRGLEQYDMLLARILLRCAGGLAGVCRSERPPRGSRDSARLWRGRQQTQIPLALADFCWTTGIRCCHRRNGPVLLWSHQDVRSLERASTSRAMICRAERDLTEH